MRKEHLKKLPVHFHKNLSTSVDSASRSSLCFWIAMSFTILIDVQRPVYDPNSQEIINDNDNDDNDDDNDNQKENHKHMTLSQVLEWFDTSKSEKNCNMYLLSVK